MEKAAASLGDAGGACQRFSAARANIERMSCSHVRFAHSKPDIALAQPHRATDHRPVSLQRGMIAGRLRNSALQFTEMAEERRTA